MRILQRNIILKLFKLEIIKFDKEYNRIYSDGFKFEHKEEPHFSNEDDYFNFHNSKGEAHIARSMAISNPEKYFKKHFKDWKEVVIVLGAGIKGYNATKRSEKSRNQQIL